MSVHGIQPKFTDYKGYQAWRSDWRELYAHAGSEVRQSKYGIKALQRELDRIQTSLILDRSNEEKLAALEEVKSQLSRAMKEHGYKRAIARKLMTALDTAKIRWQQIRDMKRGIQEQAREFPLEVEAKNIDFHFNKKSIEFDFVPAWVVKARGKTYYVGHMDCQTGFTTRETPEHPSTKGSLRVKRGTLSIDDQGSATIN